MYIPSSDGESDRDKLLDFVARYPFATVVTPAAGELWVSHLPLLARRRADRVVLLGHVARANPHWQAFERGATTAIFHGPHAYVSPTWYAKAPAVPTWNYAVVHATGQVRVVRAEDDGAFVAARVRELTEVFEGQGEGGGGAWSPSALPEDVATKKLQAIVGFELAVDRFEGKFKLGQHRSEEDRRGVIARLEGVTSDTSRALAALMRQTLD